MTAEIAILNRSAVALAADSLVTVSASRGDESQSKTYIANKLFTLSKYKPVGIMMFGSAELLDVPWETIVKAYRQQLGRRSFDTIEEYCNDLISWLGTDSHLFRARDQRYHLFVEVTTYFVRIVKDQIDNEVKAWTATHGKIGKRQVRALAIEKIDQHAADVAKSKLLPYLTTDFEHRLSNEYKDEINTSCKYVFDAYNLPEATQQKLSEIAVGYIARDIGSTTPVSGIVVAGFGDKEKFPAVRSFKTHTIACGKLIYDLDDDNSIDLNKLEPNATFGAICPFAQRDVVDSFLRGIESNILRLVLEYGNNLVDQVPKAVAQSLPKLTQADKKRLVKRLNTAGFDIFSQFKTHLNKFIDGNHIVPMLTTVSVLPKEDLAAMAESLVSLTSVKRKMSLEVETVGGPVDVAVVTKGDGFVWINRKHYFRANLNPHFVANYFERTK